jgi:hypothetical protein
MTTVTKLTVRRHQLGELFIAGADICLIDRSPQFVSIILTTSCACFSRASMTSPAGCTMIICSSIRHRSKFFGVDPNTSWPLFKSWPVSKKVHTVRWRVLTVMSTIHSHVFDRCKTVLSHMAGTQHPLLVADSRVPLVCSVTRPVSSWLWKRQSRLSAVVRPLHQSMVNAFSLPCFHHTAQLIMRYLCFVTVNERLWAPWPHDGDAADWLCLRDKCSVEQCQMTRVSLLRCHQESISLCLFAY